jgi:hypothetical protein
MSTPKPPSNPIPDNVFDMSKYRNRRDQSPENQPSQVKGLGDTEAVLIIETQEAALLVLDLDQVDPVAMMIQIVIYMEKNKKADAYSLLTKLEKRNESSPLGYFYRYALDLEMAKFSDENDKNQIKKMIQKNFYGALKIAASHKIVPNAETWFYALGVYMEIFGNEFSPETHEFFAELQVKEFDDVAYNPETYRKVSELVFGKLD